MNFYLVVFFFLIPLSTALDYDSFFICYDSFYSSTEELDQALDSIRLHYIDAFIFIFFSPISLISTLFIIISFLAIKKMRKQPGDLLFALSFSELLLTLHYLSSSIYFFSKTDSTLKTNDFFCKFNAVLSIFARSLEFIYNCAFCIYLVVVTKNVIRQIKTSRLIFHYICVLFSLIVVLIAYITDNIGKDLFGTCSVKAVSGITLLAPVVLVAYYAFCIVTIFYFKRNIPDDKRFVAMKKDFLKYYYKYIHTCMLIWSVETICLLVTMLNCKYFLNTTLNVFITLGNISKLCTPLILNLIRFQDPFLKSRITLILEKLKISKKSNEMLLQTEKASELGLNHYELEGPLLESNSKEKEKDKKMLFIRRFSDNLESALIRKPFSSPSMDDSRPQKLQKSKISARLFIINLIQLNRSYSKLNLKSESESNDENDEGLNQLRASIKTFLTYTMLIGITLHFRKSQENRTMSPLNPKNELGFRSRICYNLNPIKLLELLQNTVLNGKKSALKTKMRVLFPDLFEKIFFREEINLEESLNISENIEAVAKATAKTAGGKGGEFFFFSYDNQVILKTLSEQDSKILSENIVNYYEYLRKNKNSLIVRILGVFEFERKDIKKNLKVMLLRNVLHGFPKQCIERHYDLKGSTYERQVIKPNKMKEKEKLMKQTLKDLDFLTFEKGIFIEEEKKHLLYEQISKDANFFKERNLIDYSLLVFKVNLNQDYEKEEIEEFEKEKSFSIISSTQENGVFYCIGIVDYLQDYDIMKLLEKYGKKMLEMKPSLDTSAQDPQTYARRFLSFVKKILFYDEKLI